MTGRRADRLSYAPQGLRPADAAWYLGVGLTKLNELVKGGRIPPPKRVDGMVIHDRHDLDAAFDDLGRVEIQPDRTWEE